MGKIRAFLFVVLAYVLAGAAAVAIGVWFHELPPLAVVGLADLAATIVVFIFSVITLNSSIYDPYWSVAPVPIALYWLWQPGSGGLGNPRHMLMFVVLCFWALRLTGNWAVQWRGLKHEDWRYRDIRKQTGSSYWLVSFLGIHLMPTVLVFLGCLALWPALSDPQIHLSWLDMIDAVVAVAAVLIEGMADLQMRRFRMTPGSSEQVVPPGLWRHSRHPNYFGEVLFWWGLYLFVPLTNPGFWWTIVGPLAILFLFVGVSIPLMERHLLQRHPSFAEYRRAVPSPFFLWFARRKGLEKTAEIPSHH